MHRNQLLAIGLLLSSMLSAQQWQLMTPIKDRSDLSGVYMFDFYNGVLIDKVEKFVLKTNDGGHSWERMPYNLLSAPQDLFMWDDQHGIIAATGGRFYRTTDGWESASSVNTFLGNNYCVTFINDTIGFAGADSGRILRTIDGGDTWAQQNTPVSSAVVAVHFVNDTLGFACATGAKVLRSIDGGLNWDELTHPSPANMRDLHFYDALNGLCVGLGGTIMHTTDGGDNWTLQTTPTAESLFDIEVQGTVTLVSGDDGVFLRSTNNGMNWSLQTVGLQEHFAADINALGVGLSGTAGHVYRTEDFGQSWQLIQDGTANSYLNKVSFANDTIGATVGYQSNLGGVSTAFLRTIDGGRHWTGNGSFGLGLLGVHMRPDGSACRGGSQGVNARSSDFFATTQSGLSSPSVAIRSVHCFSNTSYIVAGGYVNSGFYKTDNGGSTWNYTSGGNIYDIYFSSDSVGYACGEGGVIHKTTDGGDTWSFNISTATGSDQFTVFFINDSVGWTGGAVSGSKTTDGGQTWTSMPSIPSFTRSIIFVDPDTGYAVGGSGQVLRSIDGGTTWSHLIDAPFDVNIGDMALVDGALIAVGNTGDVFRAQLDCPAFSLPPVVTDLGGTLYSSYQNGNQWYLNGAPVPGATDATWVPIAGGSYQVLNTDAAGCVSELSDPVVVSITGLEGPTAEKALLLHPNPVNGRLHVRINDLQASRVEVMDIHGKVLWSSGINGDQFGIDTSTLVPGTYVVKVIHGTGRFSMARFIKR